ncbi:MAG: isoprenyl transferase [bacterium]
MKAKLKKLHKKLIDSGKLPHHIAIIMDGNGRWAKRRALPRVAGHREGVNSVREIVEVCGELGIGYLTLYTFSTENWRRPQEEISALMQLLISTLRKEISKLNKNNVRLMTIGNMDKLPADARDKILEGIEKTEQNSGLKLILALNYGGREEIVEAVRKIGDKVGNKKLKLEDITKNIVEKNLYTADIPDPDFLIRTSGELRLSNFLLWQLAYTEIYVTKILWPAFRREHLYQALEDYLKRERRFGKVSEQIVK